MLQLKKLKHKEPRQTFSELSFSIFWALWGSKHPTEHYIGGEHDLRASARGREGPVYFSFHCLYEMSEG